MSYRLCTVRALRLGADVACCMRYGVCVLIHALSRKVWCMQLCRHGLSQAQDSRQHRVSWDGRDSRIVQPHAALRVLPNTLCQVLCGVPWSVTWLLPSNPRDCRAKSMLCECCVARRHTIEEGRKAFGESNLLKRQAAPMEIARARHESGWAGPLVLLVLWVLAGVGWAGRVHL